MKGYTVIVNDSSYINNTNNHLSPSHTEHKTEHNKHVSPWESTSYPGTGTKLWRGSTG
jgi:hypothetical protein